MKGAEVAMNGRDISWQADVETLLWTVEIFIIAGRSFHDDRSKFSWWQIQNSIRTGGDFHGDRWWFCFEQLRTSRWQVKNFMVTGRDFIMNSWLFNIFIMKDRFTMNGWGFHNGRSRFSWWLVEILLWMVEMVEIWFMTRGRNFHHDRLRISCW